MAKTFIFCILLPISLLSASFKVLASSALQNQECSTELVSIVGKHLNVKSFSFPERGLYPSEENGGIITAGACKIWPYKNNITIAAFIYDDESIDSDSEKALAIVFLNNQAKKVIAVNRGRYISGGPMGSGIQISIDTARYDLKAGIRAFGIDVTDGYSPNCGDGGSGPRRTLYIQDGNKIRSVLDGLTISWWQFVEGGNPRCIGSEAAEKTVIKYTGLSISISAESSNGFANLVIEEHSSFDDGRKSTDKPNRYELVYDGLKYLKREIAK